MHKLTVFQESKEYTTSFDAAIKEVHLDGQKLNDIHDLCDKLEVVSRKCTVLACITVSLALLTVSFALIAWIDINSSVAKLTNNQLVIMTSVGKVMRRYIDDNPQKGSE